MSVETKLRTLIKVADKPAFRLIHCGGNGLGKIPLKAIRSRVKSLFEFTSREFPHVSIIWSEILPRNTWRYSVNLVAMEACRRRINGFAGNLAIKLGGMYLRQPELCDFGPKYVRDDGVHLNQDGNKIFLMQIKKGICALIHGEKYCR